MAQHREGWRRGMEEKGHSPAWGGGGRGGHASAQHGAGEWRHRGSAPGGLEKVGQRRKEKRGDGDGAWPSGGEWGLEKMGGPWSSTGGGGGEKQGQH